MDKLVLQDYVKALKEFSLAEEKAIENGLRACHFDQRIQIFDGIIGLAESVGADTTSEYTGGKYPCKMTFHYDGLEFFQIEEKEEDFDETNA